MTEVFYESDGHLEEITPDAEPENTPGDVAGDNASEEATAEDPPANLDPIRLNESYINFFSSLGYVPGDVTISRSEVTKKLRFNSDNPTQPSPQMVGVYLAEHRDEIKALASDTQKYIEIVGRSLPKSNHLGLIKGQYKYFNDVLKTAAPSDLPALAETDKESINRYVTAADAALKSLSHPNEATRLRLKKEFKRLLKRAEKRQKSL